MSLSLRLGAASWNGAWQRRTVVIAGALVVFAVHFRPWEGGLLEEWALARDWQHDGGWAVLHSYVGWTLSRPLHLLPTMLGLAITNGSPTGIFAIMGLVAAAQFLAIVWALRPISRSMWLNVAVALFVGLHPLWPAGYLQRFLPAQTAALALFIALGLIVRWLQQGRTRWLIGTCITLILGFAFYEGPAVAAPLMALAVALAVRANWRRRVAVVATATAVTAVMALYSIVIVRLVTPVGQDSYELSNLDSSAVKGPRELVTYLAGTYVNAGALLVLGILAVVLLGAILSLTRVIPYAAGWLMAGVAIASPICAIVFFGSIAWLQDIDRIGYTTSLALAAALAIWPITAAGRQTWVEPIFAVALAAVAVVGCVIGIARWQPYVQIQHCLLSALEPVVKEATGDDAVVVVDHSGTFGYLYTFPLQYLAGAAVVADDDPTTVWLCFPESSQYPLPSGGVTCDPTSNGLDLRPAGALSMPGGEVDLYIGKVNAHDLDTKESK